MLGAIAILQSCCLSAPNGDPEAADLVSAIRLATLVLLAVPWVLVLGIGWWLRRQAGKLGGN